MSLENRRVHDPHAPVRAAMRLGQELVSVPPPQRDLEFHVKAHYLGDLPALASAAIRADTLRDRS